MKITEEDKKEAYERAVRLTLDVDFLTTREEKMRYLQSIYDAILWGISVS